MVLRSYILVAGIGIFALVAAALVFVHREIRETLDLDYGIKPFAVVGGRQIYLKRDAGLNHDRVALSLNGDRCVGPDDSTDYRLSDMDAGEFPIYFMVRTDELIIYESITPPTKFHWGIVVNQAPTDIREFSRPGNDYRASGISKIEIKAGELSPCR